MPSARLAIHRFHKYVIEGGTILTVKYPRAKGSPSIGHSATHHRREALSQNWHRNATSPPSHQAGGCGCQAPGQTSDTLSPRDSTPSTINSSPPDALQSKPQSHSSIKGTPPFIGFDSQINFVERLIQTASSNGPTVHCNGTTASVDGYKNDRTVRKQYGPQNNTGNSGKKRKNYRQSR